MYKWAEQTDQKLFDLFVLPASIDSETKEVIEGNMLLKGGEFEVMYADPLFLREAIGFVSRKWYDTFDKWAIALAENYNPKYNYERHEVENTSGTGTDNNTLNTTTTDRTSAFDASTFQDKDQSEEHTSNSSTSGTTGHRAMDVEGKIGQTAMQSLIDKELKLRRFSLIDQIVDVMLRELIIPVL